MDDFHQPRRPPALRMKGGNPPLSESGTALAIIDTIPSGGSNKRNSAWGGARNRRDRASCHLTLLQCECLIAAARQAERMGLAFNRHWTVHYERAGIAEIDATRFVGRLLKLAGDFARRSFGRFAAIWVRESGHGKGGHVHILLHLPPGCILRGRTAKWVRLAGGNVTARVSRVRVIGGTLNASGSGGAHYRANLEAVLFYVLKGSSRETSEELGLPRHGDGGLIIGKRCGRTQNLGGAKGSKEKK